MLVPILVLSAFLAAALFAAAIQDDGLTQEIAAIGSKATISGWKVHLYSNNVTPTTASVPGDFTESTFPGYAAVFMNSGSPGAVSGDTVTNIWGGTFLFTSSGVSAESVYGYYVTDTLGNLIFAELFSGGPYNFTASGTSLSINTITETLTRL